MQRRHTGPREQGHRLASGQGRRVASVPRPRWASSCLLSRGSPCWPGAGDGSTGHGGAGWESGCCRAGAGSWGRVWDGDTGEPGGRKHAGRLLAAPGWADFQAPRGTQEPMGRASAARRPRTPGQRRVQTGERDARTRVQTLGADGTAALSEDRAAWQGGPGTGHRQAGEPASFTSWKANPGLWSGEPGEEGQAGPRRGGSNSSHQLYSKPANKDHGKQKPAAGSVEH